MIVNLVRHGTTTSSGMTFAGRSDVPLNEEGHRMAHAVSDALSVRPISRIVSSPLDRCVATAKPLARALGLDIETDASLMEFDFGSYEGQSKAALGLKLRKLHANIPVPGGEALIDVWNRAIGFLDSLQDCRHGEIAVFGHFWMNRMMFGAITGLDFDAACRTRAYRPATGSVVSLHLSIGRH